MVVTEVVKVVADDVAPVLQCLCKTFDSIVFMDIIPIVLKVVAGRCCCSFVAFFVVEVLIL